MRKLICLLLSVALLPMLHAQVAIHPRSFAVTANKTTNLIFPSAIVSVDRGSERIIVQKSTANVLKVKADTSFADTTNLTVITTDGKLYSFLVAYSTAPSILTLDLGSAGKVDIDTAMQAIAKAALTMRNSLHGIRFSSGNVRLTLAGIYTNAQVVVCKLKIENSSSISFETGNIRVYVMGTHNSKRRSVQEIPVPVLLSEQDFVLVKERSAGVIALVIPKSGLADDQALKIDIGEKSAERHLTLQVPNRYILNGILIK